MGKHTPGPWVANDLSQRVHTEDDVTIARCEPHSTDMAKANARLIAAAPEMAEVLHECFDFLGGVDGAVELRGKVLALLSRIEGDA